MCDLQNFKSIKLVTTITQPENKTSQPENKNTNTQEDILSIANTVIIVGCLFKRLNI